MAVPSRLAGGRSPVNPRCGPGLERCYFWGMGNSPNLARFAARPVVAGALVAAASVAAFALPACIDRSGTGPYVAPATDASTAGVDSGKPIAFDAGDAAASDDAAVADAAPGEADAGVDGGPCPIGLNETVTAWLHVTADNRRTVTVNGTIVDQTENEWSTPSLVPITLYRSPLRKNVIAIEGRNSSSQDGLDRGILADIEIGALDTDTGSDAGDAGAFPVASAHVLTNATWKIAKTVPATSNWTAVDYDDSAFGVAIAQGKNGVAPWGLLPGFDANAEWIWTFVSSGTTAEKVDVESAYARKAFYFDATGKVTDTKVACP